MHYCIYTDTAGGGGGGGGGEWGVRASTSLYSFIWNVNLQHYLSF